MKRYAVINEKNEVINVIKWDGISPYRYPLANCTLKYFEECDIGDRFDPETNTIIRTDRQYRDTQS